MPIDTSLFLLAEVAAETWIGVALGCVALIGTVATGIFAIFQGITARKVARDKLEFDAKIIVLTEGQKQCEEDRRQAELERIECRGQHDEVRAELKECREQHKSTEIKLGITDARLSHLESTIRKPGDSGPIKRGGKS